MESKDVTKQFGPLSIQDGESLKDFKRRMKNIKLANEAMSSTVVTDEYALSVSSNKLLRGRTGIAYNDFMELHKCEWDPFYPENPQRYSSIMNRLKELGLLDRCVRIGNYEIGRELITDVHDPKQIEILERICNDFELHKAEKLASQYDAIYFNKHTLNCAKVSAATALGLVRAVSDGTVQNGLAVVRPPGHHAQHSDFNGYCFFNNVAIAAKSLREVHSKILIVDFDVHHGQGVQDLFYDDPNVLYFSIHRYEHGTFWPNLRRSNFDYIGEGAGKGFNINVPLNDIGLNDTDYMSIVHNILLPVAYEPELVLFCAGYDACVGCPEGLMLVSPGFYGHLIKLLSGLAYGKLAVLLEGGYFPPSLAEGVAMTLRALLDDSPALLSPMVKLPNEALIRTINDVKSHLRPYWKCFEILANDSIDYKDLPVHEVKIKYKGIESGPPFETRNCYPIMSSEDTQKIAELLHNYILGYAQVRENKVCYAYDDKMMLHSCEGEIVENPQRLKVVHDRFLELNLHKRCTKLKIRDFDVRELAKEVHSLAHIDPICNDTVKLGKRNHDLYWQSGGGSQCSVKTAVSALISVVNEVMTRRYSSGVAIIRPPGHHAQRDKSSGFCFVNNVAVAAKHMINARLAEKVLIIDFDIHHGNGTQEIFYNSKNVMYLSVHKYENASFFPKSRDADFTCVGGPQAQGYNVNVPFENEKMGCVDYLTCFFRIILPLAYAFAPDAILVSAGFDAGINDLLGNYKVMPQTFGHMIQLLRPLAGGRIIIAMEGGYNLTTLKHSMNFCIKTLLGDPLPPPSDMSLQKALAHQSFTNVICQLRQYWEVLKVAKKLK